MHNKVYLGVEIFEVFCFLFLSHFYVVSSFLSVCCILPCFASLYVLRQVFTPRANFEIESRY